MKQITWTQTFSVGVEKMDNQHKTLIDMINRLTAKATVEPKTATISDLLHEMTVYATDHFRAEEQLLEEHGYPQLAEQLSQHNEFRKRTAELCSAATQKQPSVPVELLTFLGEWLVEHILVEDMKYRTFMQAHGLK